MMKYLTRVLMNQTQCTEFGDRLLLICYEFASLGDSLTRQRRRLQRELGIESFRIESKFGTLALAASHRCRSTWRSSMRFHNAGG